MGLNLLDEFEGIDKNKNYVSSVAINALAKSYTSRVTGVGDDSTQVKLIWHNESFRSLKKRTGIYFIKHIDENGKDEIFYIGSTVQDLEARVRRFMKGVEGKLRGDENHPGAIKWKKKYGESSANMLTVQFMPYERSTSLWPHGDASDKTHMSYTNAILELYYQHLYLPEGCKKGVPK